MYLVYWILLRTLKLLQALRFLMKSNQDVLAILLHATLMHLRQRENLAGKHSMVLRKCVKTAGDGSHRILTDMMININIG